MSKLRPMKAVRETPSFDDPVFLQHFPLFVSTKIDGIRAIVVQGKVLSNTLKPFPSAFVQRTFGIPELEGFDGELVCGDPNSPTVYSDTFSAVMTHGCETPVTFYAFDLWNGEAQYVYRLQKLRTECLFFSLSGLKVLPQRVVMGVKELALLEDKALNDGYEGLIVRNPYTRYKFNRSTLRQGALIKIKRTLDSEAEIVGFEELLRNNNAAETDARGLTTRSSHQANMIPANTLGALNVRDIHTGVEFSIGVFKGFDKQQLQQVWNARDSYFGKVVKYVYLPVGVKDKPRHPRMVGFRSEIDL